MQVHQRLSCTTLPCELCVSFSHTAQPVHEQSSLQPCKTSDTLSIIERPLCLILQGGVFGLLTGSHVARFALPAPEASEETPPASAPAPASVPEFAPQPKQTHSLQPVSTVSSSAAAGRPLQAATQPVAPEATKQQQPGEQQLGRPPYSGQGALAPKHAAQAALSQDASTPSAAAESASSPAETTPDKPIESYPASKKAASTRPAEEVGGPPSAVALSCPSMGAPDEVAAPDQPGAATALQPEEPGESDP